MLFVGRFLAGVCSGAAFAAGTAWIKELSTPPYDSRAGEQAGARRAAIALSAGFGCGPLVAGLLAQWAPHPLVVAYVPHLVVMTIALLVLTGAPETVRPQAWSLSPRQLLRVPSAAHRRSHLQSWPLIVPAAGLLGCGLRAVPGVRPAGDSKTGHPGGPRSLTAIYYALTYVWFAAPIVLAELEKLASAPILLTLTGLLILVTMAAVRRASARQPAGSDPAWGP